MKINVLILTLAGALFFGPVFSQCESERAETIGQYWSREIAVSCTSSPTKLKTTVTKCSHVKHLKDGAGGWKIWTLVEWQGKYTSYHYSLKLYIEDVEPNDNQSGGTTNFFLTHAKTLEYKCIDLKNTRPIDLVNGSLQYYPVKEFGYRDLFNGEKDQAMSHPKKKNQPSKSATTVLQTETKVTENIDTTLIAAASVIDVENNVPYTTAQKSNALGVIIGIEKYRNIASVTYAENDATWVKEYFIKTLGIPGDRIYFKTNEDASLAEFEKIFSTDGWLERRCDSQTDVFIFYAGHGAPSLKDQKPYLIPQDGDPNYASSTGYPLERLYDNIAKLEIKHAFIFLDACFSGENREKQLILNDSRAALIKPKEVKSSDKLSIFSASAAEQISSAWPEKKHGLFTYFLLKGMRGDADSDSDGNVTVYEISEYLKKNVSYQAGFLDREQNPESRTTIPDEILVTINK